MPQAIERRAAPRYAAGPPTRCKLLLPGEPKPLAARVQDLSEGGLRLRLGTFVPVGSVLTALLYSADGHFFRRRKVRVVCASPVQNGPCVLGVAFSQPITAREVEALRAPASAAVARSR